MVNEYEEVVLGVHDDVVPRQDDSELPSLSVCFTIAQQHQRLIYVFFQSAMALSRFDGSNH